MKIKKKRCYQIKIKPIFKKSNLFKIHQKVRANFIINLL